MTRRPTTSRASTVPRLLVEASEWSWRLILVTVAVGGLVYAASVLSFIVGPVIVALVISALLEPVRRLLLRMNAGPAAAWFIAFLFGVVLVTSLLTLSISEFSANYDTLSEQAQGGVAEFTDWLETGPLKVEASSLNEATDRVLSTIRDDPGSAVMGTVSVLSTTGALVAGGVLAFITTLFMMKDRALMWGWFTRLFPLGVRPRVDSAGRAAWEVLVSYTKVTLTSAVVDATVLGVAAAIAGLPVAFALAAVVFMFAFIPTVGAVLSGLLIVLVALVSQGPTTALVLAAVVLVVQQVDANVMYPMLANRHLALHPLASLLIVAAGGVLAGLFGAFIAVPLVAIAIAIVGDLRRTSTGEASVAAPGAADPAGDAGL